MNPAIPPVRLPILPPFAAGRATWIAFCKLSPHAVVPTRASIGAAGYDLHTVAECVLRAGDKVLVCTGLAFQMPYGTYGRIAARSGLAFGAMVSVGGGVIDQDYTGEVRVALFNHGAVDVIFKQGDRVAQLICERIEYPLWVEKSALAPTQRGGQGFGSTGM